ncbi:MAG TPA: UDP-N-acetylglucosamine 2-epimerase (non-hydrolyzing) [Anaerolineae bacterium]|nr:UDP-N-acetylglucosamine 2-epimerase (non-hydrolyzing) [Anaerolineae bacterium]
MKVLTVVGARPQFIKAAPLSQALRQNHQEILVHTGQHYDHGMSDIFFQEMGIPQPDYNLGVGSGSHGRQTAAMLDGLEQLILQEKPDWLLVYGDTNSTLAAALAAAKLHIPVAHVEAGLRSFDKRMPEELNRILTDHVSTLLFCPTTTAVTNLKQEGLTAGVHIVGDIMYDALKTFLPRAPSQQLLDQYQLTPNEYILATLHRASNTDNRDRLQQALTCLGQSPWPIILPLHPRTKAALERHQLSLPDNVTPIPPASYLHMLALMQNSRFIMTDSGGVQKEAFFLAIPCITLRPHTEWVETVATGWNTLTDIDPTKVAHALNQPPPSTPPPPIFGDGTTAQQIVHHLTTSHPSTTSKLS